MKQLIWIVLFLGVQVQAQVDPVAHFSFDNCDVVDAMGGFADGDIRTQVDCDCGVGRNSNALYFDGTPDTIIMDQAIKDLFVNDFSISFYLWMDNTNDITSIMSVQGDCSSARDSAFFIRYFPATNEVVVNLSKNFGEIIELRGELPEDNCWNHILFTREGQVYSLYLNGIFVERFTFFDEVVLGQDFPFWLGVSPCTGVNEQFLGGRIDELKFFNLALKSETELLSVQEFPDRILSSDTTIFEGSSYMLRTSPSCADNVSWNPVNMLSDPGSPTPIVSPETTTIYTISFDHGTCISRDRITISVISDEEIQCGNILLPSAFTPNNDGVNEEYGISNAFIIEDLKRFEIFNRWGAKLYETTDKQASWNGIYDGQMMTPGVYVYKISYTCQGEEYNKTGSFNILK